MLVGEPAAYRHRCNQQYTTVPASGGSSSRTFVQVLITRQPHSRHALAIIVLNVPPYLI
jgi:hypothetical protein